MEFKKYMHIERFGTSAVSGIEFGKCHIFPKLDGTNASVWVNNGEIQAGSRKRHLSLDADNGGFLAATCANTSMIKFMEDHHYIRLYGEWLIPHSLKTYQDAAWRKFYIFDVWDELNNCFMAYSDYSETLGEYGLDYISPISVMQNPSYESLLKELENNTYLIKNGQGFGEGIVIKNYDFTNRYGNTVWAKIVSNEFKQKHTETMGAPNKPQKAMVEQSIVDQYVTTHLVNKTHAKISNESGGWTSKKIPQLLGMVFYDMVKEESWEFVKQFKNPTINFKTLNGLCTIKVKELMPELF